MNLDLFIPESDFHSPTISPNQYLRFSFPRLAPSRSCTLNRIAPSRTHKGFYRHSLTHLRIAIFASGLLPTNLPTFAPTTR